MAFREEARLPEGDGGTNSAAFADDADAALRGAIIMRTVVQQHAATALGASLFR